MDNIPSDTPQTLTVLIVLAQTGLVPWLQGGFASWFFGWLRTQFPKPHQTELQAMTGLRYWFFDALWVPASAVYTSRVLAFVGGILAAVVLALVQYAIGGPVLSTLDQGIALVIAGAAGVHGSETYRKATRKPKTIPEETYADR